MAITAYDKMNLSGSKLSELQSITDQWNSAKTQEEKDALHLRANEIRGYETDNSGQAINMPDANAFLKQANTLVNEANAVAQYNAQMQYDYNSAEAKKARDWSEYMSSTAHQREVDDLVAAGLNPVLSLGGQGASSGQAASASGSVANNVESMNSVFGQYLGSLISSATQINMANTSAKATEAAASMYTAMDYLIHQDFPQNAWQAFGPELQSLMEAAENYYHLNSGSTVSKVDKTVKNVWSWIKDKASNVKNYYDAYDDAQKAHPSWNSRQISDYLKSTKVKSGSGKAGHTYSK